MLFITFLGKHQFLIPANLFLIFYFLFVTKQTWFFNPCCCHFFKQPCADVPVKTFISAQAAIVPLLKAARGLSFPSGHAIMSVTFYGLLVYIIQHTIQLTG